MALQTKASARALIQQFIDDPAGKLWSPNNLDLLAEGALDELWGDLLDTFSWLRSQESKFTLISPGCVDLTVLTRLYRIQVVARDSTFYAMADQKDIVVSNNVVISAPDGSFTILGDQLHLFPYAMTDVYVRYSNRPAAFTSLADTDSVTWPDGYHLAYCYDIASRALEKGDREDSVQFGKRSEASLFRMKAWLRKQQVGPTVPWTNEDTLSQGSVT